jgi:hypothetical protein
MSKTASICYNDREARWARNYAKRGRGDMPASLQTVVNVTVPEDIERVTEHEPCFYCGVRAGLPCRHRRWAA